MNGAKSTCKITNRYIADDCHVPFQQGKFYMPSKLPIHNQWSGTCQIAGEGGGCILLFESVSLLPVHTFRRSFVIPSSII